MISAGAATESSHATLGPMWRLAMRAGFVLVAGLACMASGCTEGARARPPADLVGSFDSGVLEAGPDAWQGDSRPQQVDRCGGGGLLAVGTNKLTLDGSTEGLRNEYGSGIRCGGQTALDGPQRYYSLQLDAAVSYRFSLSAGFPAALYLFSSCGPNTINADCGSTGDSGFLLGPVAGDGTSASIVFTPPVSGEYQVAVGAAAEEAGAFGLIVEPFSAPENSRCARAEALTFSEGVAEVRGTTIGATNEFATAIHCGARVALGGPQRYYRLGLAAGTYYELALDADYPAVVYLFGVDAGCEAQSVESECSSVLGTLLPAAKAGQTARTLYASSSAREVIVAVDSSGASDAGGAFTLQITARNESSSMVCAAASSLQFVDGVASFNGTSADALNDRGALLRCGGVPLLGPQRYAKVALEARPYRFNLSAEFEATLVLGTSCEDLPADCGSGGLQGDVLRVPAGERGQLVFAPPSPGSYVVAVDAVEPWAAGNFELSIEAFQASEHGHCEQPQILDLGTLPLRVAGDTGPARNDLVGIRCGSAVGPFEGPQHYYRLALPAGLSLQIELEGAGSFDPALYGFAAATSCDAASVEAACRGQVSDAVGGGVTERLTLGPLAALSEWIVAVDSWSPSEVGPYTLLLSDANAVR